MKFLNASHFFIFLLCVSTSTVTLSNENESNTNPSSKAISVLKSSAELSRESIQLLGTGIDYIINPIDDYFSGEAYDNVEAGQSQIKVTYSVSDSKLGGLQSDLSFSIKAKLFKTEDRLSLFVEDINHSLIRQNSTIQSSTSLSDSSDDQSLNVGILSQFNFYEALDLNWRTGAKVTHNSIDFFAKLSNRVHFTFSEDWTSSFYNQLFFYETIGNGFLSYFTIDQYINTDWSFRSQTKLDYFYSERQFFYTQSLNWFQKFNEDRRFSYAINKYWSQLEHDIVQSDRVDTSVTMRERIYKKWTFLNLKTGYQFDRVNNFEQDPFVLLSLEIYSNDIE